MKTRLWSASRIGRIGLTVCALACSGLAHALLSAPLSWVWLHPLVWLPALFVFSRLNGWRALSTGWLVGLLAHCALFFWLLDTVETFSGLPLSALDIHPRVFSISVLLLFGLIGGFATAVFALGVGPIRCAAGSWWPVAVAAWFVACEFLNPQLFPFFQGSFWSQLPSVFLLTALTGVPGVSFLILLCNGVALQLVERRWQGHSPVVDRPVVRNLVCLVLCMTITLGWSAVRLQTIATAEASADSLRVALVQPNYGISDLHRLRLKSHRAVLTDLIGLSQQAWNTHGDIDVFVWPEGVLHWVPKSRHRQLQRFVRLTGADVWAGGRFLQRAKGRRWQRFNSALRVFGQGEISPRYDKTLLLPFGEFLPLADRFPIIKRVPLFNHLSRGTGLPIFAADEIPFVFLIGSEAMHYRYVRNGVNQGAELLVNLTQDAWFGDSMAPHQHLALAASQAAQYGVPLVRAATTGLSAVVDTRGQLVETTAPFTRHVLVTEVKKVALPSLYAAFGDWFAGLCIVISFSLLLLGSWQERAGGFLSGLSWLGVIGFVLSAPLAWSANPYSPALDWIVWIYAMGVVVVVPFRWLWIGWRRPQAEEH